MYTTTVSSVSCNFFVVCLLFSGQDKTRIRKNGNAELKSRAVNEIKNVLAEVAKVAEVLPFLPFLPVQIIIKSGTSDLSGKEERDGVGQTPEKKRSMDGGIPPETEHRYADQKRTRQRATVNQAAQ